MTFSEIMKRIREELHCSQEQFSRDLSVSFTTINRWENGRSLPSPLAKMRLIEICAAKNVSENIVNELSRPEIYRLKEREDAE